MYILTPENKSFDTARIPNITNTLHYAVLDYSNPDEVDYRFPPLVFIEDYPKANIELKIGPYIIQVPANWSILLGEQDFGDLEALPLTSLNGRVFTAFVFNPCKGYMPKFLTVDIIGIYQEIRWTIPTLQQDHLLAVPLRGGDNPDCVFFIDNKNKLPDWPR